MRQSFGAGFSVAFVPSCYQGLAIVAGHRGRAAVAMNLGTKIPKRLKVRVAPAERAGLKLFQVTKRRHRRTSLDEIDRMFA